MLQTFIDHPHLQFTAKPVLKQLVDSADINRLTQWCAQPQSPNFEFWSPPLPSYDIGRSLKKGWHHSSWCRFNVWLKHKINPLQHGSFIHPSSALAEVHHIILMIWKCTLDNSTVSKTFKNNHRFQNLTRCSQYHREGGTLGVACRLPYVHNATPNNFQRFSGIVCERNRRLEHGPVEGLTTKILLKKIELTNIFTEVPE